MTRLLALLALLFLAGLPARAEPPRCGGTDLLEKMKAENPKAFAEVLAEARAVPNGEAIFWKIEKEGVAPSHLLGTAHVTDPRVTTLSPEAARALGQAATVALELKEIRDKQEFALVSFRYAKLMVMPPGQSLWDLIPDDQEGLIRNNPNLPPGAANTLFGYQPWVVATMLSIPACEMARDMAGIASLDERIAREATQSGTELVGLETVEEQFNAFAGMPMELQARYLLAVAKAQDRALDYFETLIALYDQRLITAFTPLSLRSEPADPDTPALMAFVEQNLVVKRNHVMARRASEILAHGNAFIAVGAMHLPGPEGLVALLRQAGYKVTPVN